MGLFEQFPYTNLHELNLDWIIDQIKKISDEGKQLGLKFEELREYVIHYLDNIDIEQDVKDRIDELIEDGTIGDLINQQLLGDINDRLDADEISLRKTRILKDKKVIMIGDSYAMGSGGVDDQGWPYYLELITDCDPVRVAKMSSGGFIHTATSGDYQGQTFEDALRTIYTGLSAAQRASIEYIICCGGINDIASATYQEIGAAVTSFCSAAKSLFPNSKLYVVPLYSDATFGQKYLNGQGVVKTIANGIKKYTGLHTVYDYAVTHGACSTPYSLYWLEGRPDFGSGDTIHPNAYGYAQIGYRLAEFIEGGESIYITPAITASGVADDVMTIGGFTATVRGGMVAIQGEVRLTDPAVNKAVLNLPQNYCPGYDKYIPVILSNGVKFEAGTVLWDQDDRLFKLRALPTSFTVASGGYVRIFFQNTYLAGM